MSFAGTFFAGAFFGFIIAVLVISCCVTSKEDDVYSKGYYDGYKRGRAEAKED